MAVLRGHRAGRLVLWGSALALLLFTAAVWWYYDSAGFVSMIEKDPTVVAAAVRPTVDLPGAEPTHLRLAAWVSPTLHHAEAKHPSTAEYLRQWTDMTYEETGVNCSVAVVPAETINTNLPRCDRAILDAQLRETDAFPASGNWSGTAKNPVFHPSFCAFAEKLDVPELSMRCAAISDGKRAKFLVFGDSNGGRFALGLVRSLQAAGLGCRETRRETRKEERGSPHVRDSRYFAGRALPDNYLHGLLSLFRGTKDICFTTTCRPENKTETKPAFVIEYISSSNLIENTLTLANFSKDGAFRRKYFSTLTEYVLKHYLSEHGYPDVVAFYAPFHHEKWHAASDKAALDIAYVQSLFRIYLPASTEVFWIPDGRECVSRHSSNIPKLIREGMATNQRLHALNRLLYEVLSGPLTNPASHVHGFLDLGKISCPITCSWHADGAHMVQPWYDAVASYLLQIAC